MESTLNFLRSSALANDIAIVARRNGKTVPAYLKERMVEALMADIATDVLTRFDFSSDKDIDRALSRVHNLSDELVRAIAQFKYDARRRRLLQKLREANTEGKLSSTQREIFGSLVSKEEDLSIAKTVAYLEAHRRGLKINGRSRKTNQTSRSK